MMLAAVILAGAAGGVAGFFAGRSAGESRSELTHQAGRVLDLLEQKPGRTDIELYRATSMSIYAVRDALRVLMHRGLVTVRIGIVRNGQRERPRYYPVRKGAA